MEFSKKLVYDKLVANVNDMGTSRFVLKTKYDTDKSSLEKKIPDTSKLVKKTYYIAKITETEIKIPSISGLATTAALTAVENKISDVSNLVTTTDYDTKISDIKSKCFTTVDYNKFTSQTLDPKRKQKELVDKPVIVGFINNTDLDKKK